MPITPREQSEIDAANSSERQPVVFVHGLWLLASSWDLWRAHFDEAGYATLAPDWPDDPDSVEKARAHPETFAGKGVGAITDHYAEVIGKLIRSPAVIGHSFGGLITQKLAGQGLAAVSVPIDPAPFKGVLPLPTAALRSGFPVLKNPANRKRAVMLSYEEFRYGFVNAVSEDEAKQLYDTYPVPGAGLPIFQAAFANLHPGGETKVDTKNPERGPMKLIGADEDHTVPWSIVNYSCKLQKRNPNLTALEHMTGRGHSLVFDSGWRDVADVALRFVSEHAAA
jgi:non-heme chloroperoxidase